MKIYPDLSGYYFLNGNNSCLKGNSSVRSTNLSERTKINTVCDFASCAVFWFGYVPGPQGLAGSLALSDAVCVTMST